MQSYIDHLVDRGRRLFAQCVSWVRSEGLSVSFSLFLLSTYVLPSASFGIEFAGDCPRSLARFDRALRQWGRHLLGWPSGTPNASVLCELGLHDGLRVSSGRALALYARLASFALGSRPPVPASVFTLAQSTPGSGAHWCRAVISHHSVQRPDLFGVGPGCSASVTQRWVRRSVTPVLDRSWRQRVERSLGLLHTIRRDPRAQPQLSLPAFVYSQSVDAGLARWWGLARYGHDPGPGGRAARHRNSSPVCSFCCADVGDLAHCLSYCPAFSDLRAQWCVDTGVAPSDGPWWPLARGQHSVGHAGSRPIRGTRLLPSGTFAPILLNMLFRFGPTSPLATWSAGRYRVRLALAERLPWWRLLTCEAISTWALLSRLPFLCALSLISLM